MPAPSNPSSANIESWSKDLVSAAGLQDIKLDLDADATVAATSTAKSAAVAANVTGDSGSFSNVAFNSGLQDSGANVHNTIGVASNAGLSGIATTTANASAATSAGNATGFATIGDSAGLSDISALGVGGELTALGKSVNTITGSAETVVGQASATGSLSRGIQGFEAAGIDVSSNASIQGLAQLTNSASATAVSGTPQVGTAPSSNYAPASSNYAPASSNYAPAVGSQFLANGTTPNPNYIPQVGTAQVGTAQVGTAQVGTAQVGTAPVLFDNLSDSIYGIDIASDATLSGTAIGTLKAEAFSTATDADAMVGNGADLIGAQIGDLNVGGIASVTGAAQLTGNGTAQNVGGTNFDASASTGLDATVTGLDAKLMDVASDATITAQAFGTLNATATSTGGAATAHAGGDGADANSGVTTLTGLASGLDLNIGGVGTLSALAQGSENASATSVDGIATATAGMDLFGGQGLDFASSSNGSLTGIAKLVTTVDATSTAATAQVNGDFSAIGFTGLEIGTISGVNGATGDLAGIGGVSTIKGQAQIAGTLNAESVSGDAFAGVNDPHSIITGLNNVVLNGASDGTVLGTASGVFNTNATNIGGTGFDASAASYQDLKGISSLDLNLGGNGGINAIVNDTNFVGAHSVSGNATAVATVDAIGLAGGDIHIAGNASILSTVGVDSKAESHTMG